MRAKGWGRCVVWGGKWFPEASTLLDWWIALDRGGVCLVTACAKVLLTAK